jgi:hypothetical protein
MSLGYCPNVGHFKGEMPIAEAPFYFSFYAMYCF